MHWGARVGRSCGCVSPVGHPDGMGQGGWGRKGCLPWAERHSV